MRGLNILYYKEEGIRRVQENPEVLECSSLSKAARADPL